MDKQKTCCFTGHRQIAAKDYDRLYGEVKKLIEKLNSENDVTVFIAGGALGFDTLAAKAVLELKDVLDISLILYLPAKARRTTGRKARKRNIRIYCAAVTAFGISRWGTQAAVC